MTLANRAGQRLLDNVSLTIPAGRAVAILASDAQTPLAVAGLFVRFYDPAAGRILYDDRDIGRATLESVRQQAMLVTADGPLFPAALSENIVCGKPGYTASQIGEAVKQAQADEFVLTLSDGLSTIVGGKDSPLQVDQAFRIGLARALLRDPSVIIVQEPDGRLEEASVRRLDLALRQAAAGRTLVVLPARLNTLRAVDCIYLFHEGKLHAQGTHAELLQSSELYRHLNYVRFNPFRNTVSG